MLVVKKFGGTSVANKERIFNVANRCIEEYKKGNDVVVVLSAMGKQTDVLINMAKEINPNPPRRELDMLMTTGEQVSVAMMAMAMDSLRCQPPDRVFAFLPRTSSRPKVEITSSTASFFFP